MPSVLSALEQTLLALCMAGVLLLAFVYLFYPAIFAAREDALRSLGIRPRTIQTTNDTGGGTSVSNTMPLLTLVIPAYDEEERLPSMIQEAYSYLNRPICKALNDLENLPWKRPGNNTVAAEESKSKLNGNQSKQREVEWIVVDDGSRDGTCRVYENCLQRITTTHNAAAATAATTSVTRHCWKLISFPHNCGKGAAVRSGMLAATGEFCLMVDADGATEFGRGLEALVDQLVQFFQQQQQDSPQSYNTTTLSPPILVGSRAHMHHQHHQQEQGRSAIRTFLTEAFHIFVVIFVGAREIRDTQCGFKLFSRETAHHLFGLLHLRRWAFDTELLFLATHLNYALREVVVPWHEVEGSKLHTSVLNLAIASESYLSTRIAPEAGTS